MNHNTGEDRYYFIQGTLTHIEREKGEPSEPLDIALGYGFAHKKSRGHFSPSLHLQNVDADLLPDFSLFDAMWKGLQKHMPQTEIFSEINAVPREGLQLSTPVSPPSYHNEAILELLHKLESPCSLNTLNQDLNNRWPNFCSYGDLY